MPTFLQELLGDVPEAAFFGAVQPFSNTPAQKRFFGGQFSNVYNQFLGQLGQDIFQGRIPTQSFSDFSQEFDFNELFQSRPFADRGFNNFNPRTRWLLGF